MKNYYIHTIALVIVSLIIYLIFFHISRNDGKLFETIHVLGDLQDASGEALLHGSVDIPLESVKWEAFHSNGKVVTYFGIFPAFLRIIGNFFYPEYRGMWARLSILTSALILLIFVYLSISLQLKKNLKILRFSKIIISYLTLIGIGLSSPIFFITSYESVYNETNLWAVTFSITAIYFLLRIVHIRASQYSYVAFAICSSCCLLTRVSTAIPLMLLAGILFVKLIHTNQIIFTKKLLLVCLYCLPLMLSISLSAWLNYERFGNILEFCDLSKRYRSTPVTFQLDRLYVNFKSYFLPELNIFSSTFPFVSYSHPRFEGKFGYFHVEKTLALTITSPWLLLFSLWGYLNILKARWIVIIGAILFSIPIWMILTFFAIINRYSNEFLPFLTLGIYILFEHIRLVNKRLSIIFCSCLAILILIGSILNIFSIFKLA